MIQANDAVGIDQENKRQRIVKLPTGTKVLVIKDHAPPRTGRSVTISSKDLTSALLNVRADNRDEYPLEVRIDDGPDANSLAFIDRNSIARLYERRVAPPFKANDRASVIGPETMIAKEYEELYIYIYSRIDNDQAALNQSIRDGGMARLAKGAKVIILGTQGQFARVRVHSGSKLAGLTGFVLAGDLMPIPSQSR